MGGQMSGPKFTEEQGVCHTVSMNHLYCFLIIIFIIQRNSRLYSTLQPLTDGTLATWSELTCRQWDRPASWEGVPAKFSTLISSRGNCETVCGLAGLRCPKTARLRKTELTPARMAETDGRAAAPRRSAALN